MLTLTKTFDGELFACGLCLFLICCLQIAVVLPHHIHVSALCVVAIVVCVNKALRYNDVIMGAMASQITSLTIVNSIVYSDADKKKHQSSASLALCGEFTGDPWIPRTNGQLRGKCFHLMTSSWRFPSHLLPLSLHSTSRQMYWRATFETSWRIYASLKLTIIGSVNGLLMCMPGTGKVRMQQALACVQCCGTLFKLLRPRLDADP